MADDRSTRCEFRVGVNGMVVPSQVRKAEEAGCRVVRFKDVADERGPHEYSN